MRKGMNVTPEFWMVAVAIIFTVLVLIIGYQIFFERVWYGNCWADTKKNLTFMAEGDNYFEFGDCIEKVVFTGRRVYDLEENCKYTKPKDGEGYTALVVMHPKSKSGLGALADNARFFTDTWNKFQESHQDITCILHNDFTMEGQPDMVFEGSGIRHCVYLQKPTPEAEYMSIGECEIGGGTVVNPDKDYLERCWETLVTKLGSVTDGRNEIQFGDCVSEVIFSSGRSVSGHECDSGESGSYAYIVPSIAAQDIGKGTECIGMGFALKGDVTVKGLGKTSCINVEDKTEGKEITVC